jgi:hypothetical protein
LSEIIIFGHDRSRFGNGKRSNFRIGCACAKAIHYMNRVMAQIPQEPRHGGRELRINDKPH